MSEEIVKIEEERTSLLTGKPIRKPLFYESMTTISCPHTGARIRVWRSEATLPEYADEEILLLFKFLPEGAMMEDVINMISTLERVTAVELTDKNGLGCVAYFEW